MDIDAQLVEALKQFKQIQSEAVPAKVTCVEGLMADVMTVEGQEIYDVRLCASDTSASYVKPTQGSWVIIAPLMGKEDSYYIAAFTEIEELVTVAKTGLTLKTEEESLLTILTDILVAIENMNMQTPSGPSSLPNNLTTFSDIRERLSKLFIE